MGRIFAAALLCILCVIALLSSNPALASADCTTTPIGCVPRINTVHDVNTTDLYGDNYTSFYLVSYGTDTGVVTPGDGAAGLFVRGNAVGTHARSDHLHEHFVRLPCSGPGRSTVYDGRCRKCPLRAKCAGAWASLYGFERSQYPAVSVKWQRADNRRYFAKSSRGLHIRANNAHREQRHQLSIRSFSPDCGDEHYASRNADAARSALCDRCN